MYSAISFNPIMKEASTKPGPGAYDPSVNATKHNKPSFKMPKSRRADLALEKF
jgi:hypothetical protein